MGLEKLQEFPKDVKRQSATIRNSLYPFFANCQIKNIIININVFIQIGQTYHDKRTDRPACAEIGKYREYEHRRRVAEVETKREVEAWTEIFAVLGIDKVRQVEERSAKGETRSMGPRAITVCCGLTMNTEPTRCPP
jgi:hypothetical protein